MMKLPEVPTFSKKPSSPNFLDIDGMRFGMLTVIGYAGSFYNGKHSAWYCRCDCGNVVMPKSTNLRSGSALSCGCLNSLAISERMKTHGHSSGDNLAIYRTWRLMLYRCENKKSVSFKNYGGRGIKVCERWMKFENFLADMGERPDGMSIDRVDVNGNYEPGNCRWATPKDQNNNKTNNVNINFMGVSKTPQEWSSELGIPIKTIYNRRLRGLPVHLVLSTNKRVSSNFANQ